MIFPGHSHSFLSSADTKTKNDSGVSRSFTKDNRRRRIRAIISVINVLVFGEIFARKIYHFCRKGCFLKRLLIVKNMWYMYTLFLRKPSAHNSSYYVCKIKINR